MNARSSAAYPATPRERTRWIVDRRDARNRVDAERPHAFFLERERTAEGDAADVATVFLTNRECAWKCVMCDLWRNTLTQSGLPGAIGRQVEFALGQLPPASVLKLYNSGSFFDRAAIPPAEHESIAAVCQTFRRVIVECHPRLVSERILGFHQLLKPSLEVALGLETAEPKALDLLNKKFRIEDFRRATEFLLERGIAVRSFLLVHPPFIPMAQREEWLRRSIDFAFDCGSSVVSLIPARGGSGAMDQLARDGQFSEPRIGDLEEAMEYGLSVRPGRVFADVWDLQRFSRCDACYPLRHERLVRMNLSQSVEPRVACHCND